jgi:hypothetical protein
MACERPDVDIFEHRIPNLQMPNLSHLQASNSPWQKLPELQFQSIISNIFSVCENMCQKLILNFLFSVIVYENVKPGTVILQVNFAFHFINIAKYVVIFISF